MKRSRLPNFGDELARNRWIVLPNTGSGDALSEKNPSTLPDTTTWRIDRLRDVIWTYRLLAEVRQGPLPHL